MTGVLPERFTSLLDLTRLPWFGLSDEGRLVLSVGPDGATRLGIETVDAQALQEKLQAAVSARQAKSQPAPAVSLLADKDAPSTPCRAP